jgi:putative flavoprotein involved in K+ transport
MPSPPGSGRCSTRSSGGPVSKLHRPALLDSDGRPRHHDGAAPLTGVWYVGLRWLTHRASGNFRGFPADAAATADAVVTHRMVTVGGGR